MPLIDYEINLWNKGYKLIAGVDEVGRGCLAGPVVTAAVIWSPRITTSLTEDEVSQDWLNKVNDSKKLTLKRRTTLAELIKKYAICYSIIEIDNKEIDKYGIGIINKLALEQAVDKLTNQPELVLVDHFHIFQNPGDNPNFEVKSITRGDSISFSIAAASIIAKDYRDKLMSEKYHTMYPLYGFDKHVGYGTKKHVDAIKQFGYLDIHRRSFHLKHI